MIKETEHQRQAREEAENIRIFDAFKNSYNERLCGLLFNYLTLDKSRFTVTRDKPGVYTFQHYKLWESVMSVCSNFDMNFKEDASNDINLNSFIYTFEQFERFVVAYKEELEAAQELHMKKQAALAKLTKEEREFFGI